VTVVRRLDFGESAACCLMIATFFAKESDWGRDVLTASAVTKKASSAKHAAAERRREMLMSRVPGGRRF
jgi:hypothetical protein